jgi:microcystin-dependent protein
MKSNRQYTKPQTQRFYDEVPIGQEVDLLLDENNPNIPDGYVLMEGQTLNDSESPLDGQTLPKGIPFPSLVDALVGMVADFAMDTAPDYWVAADGSELAIADYPKLYNRYGTTHGSLTDGAGGSGSTHFRIPDYREIVRVGAGTNDTESIASHDTYNVGEFKDDQMQQITGSANADPGSFTNDSSGAFTAFGVVTNGPDNGTRSRRERVEFDSADSPDARTGTTSRTKQAGVLTCIFAGE